MDVFFPKATEENELRFKLGELPEFFLGEIETDLSNEHSLDSRNGLLGVLLSLCCLLPLLFLSALQQFSYEFESICAIGFGS
jgi:hypothetical protein